MVKYLFNRCDQCRVTTCILHRTSDTDIYKKKHKNTMVFINTTTFLEVLKPFSCMYVYNAAFDFVLAILVSNSFTYVAYVYVIVFEYIQMI